MKAKVLILEDDAATAEAYERYLSRMGFGIHRAGTLSEARVSLATEAFDAVLLDLGLPDGSGLDFIGELRECRPAMAIVVVTGSGEVPTAVEAMRRGADNYLTKPVRMSELELFLCKCLEIEHLRKSSYAQRRLAKQIEPFLGRAPAMAPALDRTALAAERDCTVLLSGETGTGKGVFARLIHERSARAAGTFVEVNCSALKGELLSSELFGHARGAFTSAFEDREGLIEVASGGTLFLDEIGDLEHSVQSQFLKVVEEKRFRRVGEARERASDFRLIAATNRDIEGEVEAGRFRRDLYFRLNVLPIHIPPLRERLEDFPGLMEHMLRTLGHGERTVTPEAEALLSAYSWPGNIRELKNLLDRALLLGPVNK